MPEYEFSYFTNRGKQMTKTIYASSRSSAIESFEREVGIPYYTIRNMSPRKQSKHSRILGKRMRR